MISLLLLGSGCGRKGKTNNFPIPDEDQETAVVQCIQEKPAFEAYWGRIQQFIEKLEN